MCVCVCVVADEVEPNEAATDEPNLIVTNLGHLNLVSIRLRARVCVQTKARAKVRAREKKG